MIGRQAYHEPFAYFSFSSSPLHRRRISSLLSSRSSSCALGFDPPILQHQDAVGAAQRGAAVRNHQAGRPAVLRAVFVQALPQRSARSPRPARWTGRRTPAARGRARTCAPRRRAAPARPIDGCPSGRPAYPGPSPARRHPLPARSSGLPQPGRPALRQAHQDIVAQRIAEQARHLSRCRRSAAGGRKPPVG